jgi:hypothetical protein
MKKIKIGQIGIGHNHGEGKMKAVRTFPDVFEWSALPKPIRIGSRAQRLEGLQGLPW